MTEQLLLNVQLHEKSHFDTFTVGDNAQVVDALKQAVNAQDERFVYLFGEQGVGRTHLLQACCHLAEQAGRQALYLPLGNLQDFTPEVFEGLQNFDIVCLDDVHVIQGLRVWEEALFHLYNALRDAGGALIVAADQSPVLLPVKLPDLQSRLAWGLAFQVHGLSDENKLKNLHLRAGLICQMKSRNF